MKKEQFYTNKNISKIKIGLLSDIHYYDNYNNNILKKLEKQILDEKPNYLVIAGDLLDKANYKYDGLLEFLKNVAKTCIIIIILGNHDIYIKPNKKKIVYYANKDFINDITSIDNIYLLDDTTYIDNNICFYGFTLPLEHYYSAKENYNDFLKQIDRLKTNLDPNNYNILLLHSPVNIYNYIKNNPNSNLAKTDLILSGHMHNGCLPYWITNIFNKIFKTNMSLISPEKKLFPKFSQGRIYKIKDGIIYEGLSKLSYSTRMLHIFDKIYHKKVLFFEINKEN